MNRTQKFLETTKGKIILTAVELVILTAIVVFMVWVFQNVGLADTYYDGQYVLCMDRVNVRLGASSRSSEVGWLEVGDVVYPDGHVKNGYVHCEIPSIESGEGWVHRGYLVDSKPEKVNRTAVVTGRSKVKARKNVGGRRTGWLKPGAELKVYYWTDSWCLTNCGYVMSEFLELDGE